MEASATGTCRRLMAVKSSSPFCWRAACIAGSIAGAKFSIMPWVCQIELSTPSPVRTMTSCRNGRDRRGLELQQRIGAQALEHDRAHLVVEALEAAEPVEHAFAPEELVGVGRQLVAMVAQPQARIGAMLGEIACDDAVLQHAAER